MPKEALRREALKDVVRSCINFILATEGYEACQRLCASYACAPRVASKATPKTLASPFKWADVSDGDE